MALIISSVKYRGHTIQPQGFGFDSFTGKEVRYGPGGKNVKVFKTMRGAEKFIDRLIEKKKAAAKAKKAAKKKG